MLWFKLTKPFFQSVRKENISAEFINKLDNLQEKKDREKQEQEKKYKDNNEDIPKEGFPQEGFTKEELLKLIEEEIEKESVVHYQEIILRHAKVATKEFFIGRTQRFFNRYGNELTNLAQLLAVRLKQLALAYTLEHNLPHWSIQIESRAKTLESSLKKLERNNWPYYYFLFKVIPDLVGARIICWFPDDCTGMLNLIKKSKQISTDSDSEKDFYIKPAKFRYRAIHTLAEITYDRVETGTVISDAPMTCEIQIKTKLDNVWAEMMHPLHKSPGCVEPDYEMMIEIIANNLKSVDESINQCIKKVIQKIIRESYNKHEGLKRGN